LRAGHGPPKGGHYALLLLLLVVFARPSEAAVADYIGKTVVEVRLQSNGRELRDPALVEIIETRTGAPLEMVQVRESMAHLFGLGLYQDVQVDAALREQGVVLTYTLVPAQRFRRIEFDGSLGVPDSELRRILLERHGSSLSLARANQVISTLQAVYRERGYPKADITVSAGGDPSNAAMVIAVRPGDRARIAAIDVQGSPRGSPAELLNRLQLKVGDFYDGVELDERLIRYANDLRDEGYYEARTVQLPRYTDGDTAVNLTLSVEPGPRVEIDFQGDPLTASERNQLVPIAREHSVDEDLLEDSKFGIERHFRERGFCNPRADYERAESEGVLRVTFTVTRGPQCLVEQVEVAGNSSIPSAELAPLVVTKVGLTFSESTVAADATRIQGYYRQRGFAGVKVTSQVERREPKAGSEYVRVRLVIAEGVRSLIDSVSFQGNTAVPADTLRKTVTSTTGQPYFEPQISADADSIMLLYLNRGYPEVSVQPMPKGMSDGSKVEVNFAIHEGPQILIDHVLIVGNERTRRETILREVQLKSGQPLSQQQEDETRTRLTALGLFRRIDISYLQLPGEQNQRDVVITVDEAPVTTIAYGGGVEGGKRLVRSSAGGDAVEEFQIAPRGFFQVNRRNLFGKDRSLSLFGSASFRDKGISVSPTPVDGQIDEGGYGFNEYLLRATFGERRIFGTETDATLTAAIEQGVRSSFDFNRRGVTAIISRRLTRTILVSGHYGLDNTKLLNIKSNFAAQPQIDRLFPQVRLSSVSSSVIRDTRIDLLEPNSGTLLGADIELASRGLGSEVGFIKTFFQGFSYHALPRASATVLALGARVGLATGFPRTVTRDGQDITVKDIPASERFYAGGDTTVRGFTLDLLGTPDTIDQDGFPRGGHAMIVLNAEARIPVRGGLGAVAFVDGGNVFGLVEEMDLTKLRGAIGFGLRYRSPVGPIRVDLGFKLDRRLLPTGELERPTALHISLGQAF
jgi:outer membrane protein assembly complex protein YaeT